MKSVLIVACALLLPVATLASANEGEIVYQRQRMPGELYVYHVILGGQGFGHPGFGGFHNPWFGGFHNPGFGGFHRSPQVSGSWHARPYPTHLDYFRLTR
jgi:hypothetical protein